MRPSPDLLLAALAGRQHGLVTARQALAAGLNHSDIRTRCRRGQWRGLARSVYLLDADMYADSVPRSTWWRAALLTFGADFCLVATTGATAFGLQGLPPGPRDIEIARIGGLSSHPRPLAPTVRHLSGWDRGIVVRQLVVRPDEVVTVDGLPVRDLFHTVLDAALTIDRAAALAIFDSALHQGLLVPDELQRSVADSRGRRGIVAVRELAALADGRAASQVESRVRLAATDGGVPPDDLQHEVRDEAGHVIALGDLAWLKARRRPLLGEADGKSIHSLPEPVYRDRRRGNALTVAAYDTVRFTYADTFRRGYIPWVIRNALAGAA